MSGVLGFILMLLWSTAMVEGVSDYGKALSSSLLFFEAQRAGKLPADQRVQWRGNSALKDGSDAGIDLSGGYYDAGDNVKFGFPMAYTITMLSWGTLDFQSKLIAKHELPNALKAIRWGTDYLIKAHPQPDVLYGEVGDGDSDHACWQRPEEMTTPRNSYKVTDQNPSADLAGETAAAFSAASIAFRSSDAAYSNQLLTHAKQLFNYAQNHPGTYDSSIPAGKFYKSSGYQDELLWAAAWLYRATHEKPFLDFLSKSGSSGGVQSTFSWDNKYAGAQILVGKLVLDGAVPSSGVWSQYKSDGEQFLCNCVGKGNSNVQKTAGGLLWFLPWANLQYVGSASLAAVSYASYLYNHKANLQCSGGTVTPENLVGFARSQMDYILGNNPKGMSYMVGYGSNYPTQLHHRGASIVSIKKDHSFVSCKTGFDLWFNRNAPNPNVVVGAIVGGPDQQDAYNDQRSNYQQAETGTSITAPFVGVLASLV